MLHEFVFGSQLDRAQCACGATTTRYPAAPGSLVVSALLRMFETLVFFGMPHYGSSIE